MQRNRPKGQYELVFRYADHDEVIAMSLGAVEVGGILNARGFDWLVERAEDAAERPVRRFICVREWLVETA